jgi:serine/threonine-protein phosphatase 6 regulatory ankyrin repeat subunit B
MRGADFSIVNNAKKSPREVASENDKAEVARFLVEYKADINLQGKLRSSTFDTAQRSIGKNGKGKRKASLHSASEEGNIQDVALLLKRGALVDSRNKSGWTPLHVASRRGHLQVLRMLIDNRADVNAKKQDLWTPLHISAANGHLQAVELLLDCGADAEMVNDGGHTPYQLSLSHGYRKIAEFIKERTARRA